MKSLPLFSVFFLPAVCPSSVACQPVLDAASSRLFSQLHFYPQEKVYVHTDKDFYLAGDTLWFRAHVVDACTHAPGHSSKYVYAELQSHEPPASGASVPSPVRVRIAEREGIYAGYFALPLAAKSGKYTLTAYTGFMRNAGSDYFFRKNIHVGAYGKPYEDPEHKRSLDRGFEVGFYPEGGYLVSDRRCCVGFRALRADGTSASVRGRITDDRGAEVATFSSLHAGLGKVFFTPQAGRIYTAACTNDASGEVKRFRLPAARSDACVLQVFPASERFTVDVCCGADFAPPELYLLIHCRGQLCYCAAWDGRPLSFERRQLPDGVLQLLLLDRDHNTLSERLVFCYNEREQPELAVSTDKPGYGRREKVSVLVTCRDTDGRPLEGSVSVSVTDNRAVDPYRPSDIRTSLLLESELRGYIEDPAFYFDAAHPENLAQTDALMLTQGWRRYDIPAALRGKYAYPSEPLEIGQQITGRLRKTGLFRKRNFKGYRVDMLAPRQGVFASAQVDSAGRFTLDGFELPDSTLCVLQASGKDGRQDVELLVDSVRFPACGSIPAPGPTKYPLHDYSRLGPLADSIVPIPEVVIRAKIPRTPTTPFEALASRSVDYTKIEKENYTDIRELLIKNGIIEYAGKLKYRGSNIKFIVDGVIQDDRANLFRVSEYPEDGHRTRQRVQWARGLDIPVDEFDYNAVRIESVKRVDIIPSVNTALFGIRIGRDAAVVITTKTGAEQLTDPKNPEKLNMILLNPSGYQKPVEFYSPKYETLQQKNAPERDLRTTLYWNPDVRIDPDGHASFEFYTADRPADYTIDIEGILHSDENSTRPKTVYYEIET